MFFDFSYRQTFCFDYSCFVTKTAVFAQKSTDAVASVLFYVFLSFSAEVS